MAHTAGAIAGGDLSHRVEPADPRTEVGRLGIALNAMLERLEQRVRRARGERGPPAAVPRRRLARAAHAAGIDSRLCRAVPHRRGARAGRRREGDAPHRGGGRADGRARRGPAHARPARRDTRRRARGRSTSPRSRATPSPTRARRRRTARSRCTPDRRRAAIVLGDPHQLHQVLANLLRNALVHTPPGTPIEVTVARRRRRGRARGARPRPGPAGRAIPQALFERFWRAEGGAGASAARPGPGSGSRSSPAIVEPTAARRAPANAPGGGGGVHGAAAARGCARRRTRRLNLLS